MRTNNTQSISPGPGFSHAATGDSVSTCTLHYPREHFPVYLKMCCRLVICLCVDWTRAMGHDAAAAPDAQSSASLARG